MEDNAGDVSNRTANSTISSEQENTVYSLKLDDGELSEEENDELSPSMKEACGDRPIVKTTVQETDQAVFNEMAAGGIVSVPQSRNSITRTKRQTGCNNVKVEYFYFSGHSIQTYREIHSIQSLHNNNYFFQYRDSAPPMVEDAGGGHILHHLLVSTNCS